MRRRAPPADIGYAVRMRPNWFIAWPVAVDGGWLARLDPPAGVRVFSPDDLHATVAFLGPVDEGAARRAWAGLPDDLGGALTARWGPVVPMGDPRRPSAFSALLEAPDGALGARIAALRGPLLAAAGARPDPRAPKPHVTVARPQRRATDRQREAAVRWAQRLALPDAAVPIGRIALYTWSEDRRERLFRVVDQRPLG